MTDLPFRSQCTCQCHTKYSMVHMVPCCRPDPSGTSTDGLTFRSIVPADWYIEHSGQRFILDWRKVEAEVQRLQELTTRLRTAAESVCLFNWPNYDQAAVEAITELRLALEACPSRLGQSPD